jgi:hypothetical protein
MTLLALAALGFTWSNTPGSVRYRDGTRPAGDRALVPHSHEVLTTDFFAWNVRTRITTTFQADTTGSFLGRFHASYVRLDGRLSIRIPPGCADRHVGWRIAINGAPVSQDTTKWRGAPVVSTPVRVDHAIRTVTLTAWWNGGTAPCAAFTLVWSHLELNTKTPTRVPAPPGSGPNGY